MTYQAELQRNRAEARRMAREAVEECIEGLCSTGINLLGRRFSRTNNGSLCRDDSQELVEIVVFPSVSTVRAWGRYREYGNRTTSLVVDACVNNTSYELLYLREGDQDCANRAAFSKLMRVLPKASLPSNKACTIQWSR